MSPVQCFIGLGSNLANPAAQVTEAIAELAELESCNLGKVSSLYRSKPVGPQDQPDFINAVAELETSLSAQQLLDQLQHIEQAHQRVRERHWGPRTLDLDILLYGMAQIKTPRLTIPHAFMTERNFVLYPLTEIYPEIKLPDGTYLSQHLVACPMGTLTKIRV